MNLQSKEFDDARLNSFTELPSGTRGKGKGSRYIPVRNPLMSWWSVNEDDVLYEFKDYIELFIKVNNLDRAHMNFYYHRVVGEICIEINGKWSGYFDNDLITKILIEAKEQGIKIN